MALYIGYMGDVVFVVSSVYMRTPKDLKRSGGSRWAEHELILRKPVSQYTGPSLETITFQIILRADHGMNPESELRTLRRMRDTGAVFPLIIGGKPLTQNYWRLTDLTEDGNYYSSTGQLIQSTPTVTLQEYETGNYKEEETMVNKYGQIFNTVSMLAGGL